MKRADWEFEPPRNRPLFYEHKKPGKKKKEIGTTFLTEIFDCCVIFIPSYREKSHEYSAATLNYISVLGVG
jgi:hypothetical protein